MVLVWQLYTKVQRLEASCCHHILDNVKELRELTTKQQQPSTDQ